MAELWITNELILGFRANLPERTTQRRTKDKTRKRQEKFILISGKEQLCAITGGRKSIVTSWRVFCQSVKSALVSVNAAGPVANYPTSARSSDSMTKITRDVLFILFARLRAGSIPARLANISLKTLVDLVLKILSRKNDPYFNSLRLF